MKNIIFNLCLVLSFLAFSAQGFPSNQDKHAEKALIEEQNHNIPPKDIVEKIFRECGNKYKGSVDARRILESARYQDIAELCPQAFKPFVQFLENLSI